MGSKIIHNSFINKSKKWRQFKYQQEKGRTHCDIIIQYKEWYGQHEWIFKTLLRKMSNTKSVCILYDSTYINSRTGKTLYISERNKNCGITVVGVFCLFSIFVLFCSTYKIDWREKHGVSLWWWKCSIFLFRCW